MAAYHQMGHHSENLLSEDNLSRFSGAILSPVNYTQPDIMQQVRSAPAGHDLDFVFDPQLYFPNTQRGHLRQWRYFPEDVDTADISSLPWWDRLLDSLANTLREVNPNGVCSPAVVPRTFGDEYFTMLVTVGANLCASLKGSGIRILQTAIVRLADLTDANRALHIASILSRSEIEELYLVFLGDTEPRRELSDPEELKGAMRLISALRGAGLQMLIGFCSSEVILWKVAGATHCATGKFFNLRRFTPARWEEPPQGGGQLPYWFEESLLAFLREADLIRVRQLDLLSEASSRNPFGQSILAQLDAATGHPWVGMGWRQYMHWFAEIEHRIDAQSFDVRTLLRETEQRWLYLEDNDVLMEEPRNDGSWLRPWRRALAEYQLS